jgi:hypothetical protein
MFARAILQQKIERHTHRRNFTAIDSDVASASGGGSVIACQIDVGEAECELAAWEFAFQPRSESLFILFIS